MSSPVSTGILKFWGSGPPSAHSGISALGAPPARSRGARAAPRFPTLCKRCASFRTTNQQPAGFAKVTGRTKKGAFTSHRGKVKHELEGGDRSHSRCVPGSKRWRQKVKTGARSLGFLNFITGRTVRQAEEEEEGGRRKQCVPSLREYSSYLQQTERRSSITDVQDSSVWPPSCMSYLVLSR